VAEPARALANLEALVAGGGEVSPEIFEPLLGLFGGSQSLASTVLRLGAEGLDWFRLSLGIRAVSAERHVAELLEGIARSGGSLSSEEVPAVLRRYKQRQVLRIGARDLLGLASVEETMREISSLAEGAIEVALRHARARVVEDYGEFDQQELRFAVLAMGKLGGAELNFSSDVDLVYLYSGGGAESRGGRRGRASPQAWAAKLAEILTRSLSERSPDGFVFRVDLRLRPDGQSGPIVNSLGAALAYYEAWGQTWERAAMLKARPIAGDPELGRRFLSEVSPFVYRRYLDFTTLEDIQEMKARVAREHSRERLERNVKLGPGGIRDVEFVVQVLQLIHGGRDPRLRVRSTLEALRAIAAAGVVDPPEAEALAAAYSFLRDVEHKLQIVHERQTHSLPENPREERLLARRLGLHRDPAAPGDGPEPPETRRLRAELERHRSAVRRSFEKLFFGARERIQRHVDEESTAVLQLLDDPEAARRAVARMGFRDPDMAVYDLRRLRDGGAARASARRRRALLELAPALFSEIRRTSDPDLALHHMAEFVAAVGARTSFLLLLRENPETLRLLAGLFGSSRFLSSFFVRHPELLDSLVRADLARVHKDRATLEAELASLLAAAPDYESSLDALRRFRNEEFLRIGVNDIHGSLDFDEVAEQLSDLAEACLAAALRIAEGALRERLGPLPGRFGIVGMGTLGARELNYNSDLDLVFVYDAPEPPPEALVPHEAYTRLAQRLITVLQLTTREGYVYKIDMRLRPSGSAGPLVSSLEAYRRYHRTASALWERQALIRARGVAGDRTLLEEVERIREEFVYGRGLSRAEVAEIARIRNRMEHELARENPRRWNLKTGRGGLVDVEFLVQMLQLRHGREEPAVRCRRTQEALRALRAAGFLSEGDFRVIDEGYRFLRRVENALRLERELPVEVLEQEAAPFVARRLGFGGDPETAGRALLEELERVRESIREVYQRHFG
jgi:glutamate-ammonia-ligase adenylyltransferase